MGRRARAWALASRWSLDAGQRESGLERGALGTTRPASYDGELPSAPQVPPRAGRVGRCRQRPSREVRTAVGTWESSCFRAASSDVLSRCGDAVVW